MKNNLYTTLTAHKNVQNDYNEKCTYNIITYWNLLYALKTWNCLNFIQKRGLVFFSFFLNQVAIYYVQIALRLILKDKGGKQYYLMPFVGSNLGVVS